MVPPRALRFCLVLYCFLAVPGCGDDESSQSLPDGGESDGQVCSGHGALRGGGCECDLGYEPQGANTCVPVTAPKGSAQDGGAVPGHPADAAGSAMPEAAASTAVDAQVPGVEPLADAAARDATVVMPSTADAAASSSPPADAALTDAGTVDASPACSDLLELQATRARWSAYVVDDGLGVFRLWTQSGNDVPLLLFEAEWPLKELRWSEDGKWLAFVEVVSDYVAHVHLVDFRGEQPLDPILVGDWEETAGTPRWSPDSTRLVYAGINGLTLPGLRLVDVSGALPSAPVAIAENCPQGAYAEYPCLFLTQPALLEWSPDGSYVAFLTAPFFDDLGTGSAADLFIVPAAVGEAGMLASPFVPSFDPARRGVAAATFAWSPDSTRVAYAGSFEDRGNIAEAYVFDVRDSEAGPIKLHPDLSDPHVGAERFAMVWGSNTQVMFSADLTSVGRPELFGVEVATTTSDAGTADGGATAGVWSAPEVIVDVDVRAAALSADGNSLLVASTVGDESSASLTVYAFDGTASNPRSIAANVAEVGGGFGATLRWASSGSLLAFVQAGASVGSSVSIVGLLNDGSACIAASFPLTEPEPDWRWLRNESSIVVNEPASGVLRLAAQATQPEVLAATDLDSGVVYSWAVQP